MKGSKLRTSDSEARQGFKRGLKKARIRAGYKTQQDFADAFGTNVDNVKNWEQINRAIPEIDTISKICDFLECSLDYIFDRIDCKTHDTQFICDYTGLDEDAVEYLHKLLKDDGATMNVLSYLIRCDTLLDKLVRYYASKFDVVAKSEPFSLIPYDREKMQRKFAYADILEALPEDAGVFFYNSQKNPTITKEMVFKLIWGCVDNDQAIELLNCLYSNHDEAGISSQLGMIANLLASDPYYVDMAKRLEVNLEEFYCTEQEGTDNGTN